LLAQEFYKTVVKDEVNILDRLIKVFDIHSVRYCIIGGQAVNAYAEPVVSLDLDIVVAAEQLRVVEELLLKEFTVTKHEHSLHVSAYGSDLRIQIQTDPKYADFPDRAEVREVLGVKLPVASLTDLLQGKVWAVTDKSRRTSKRLKDLSDIARLLEVYPRLRDEVPEEILKKLE
jgi:hypothetical protein